MARIKYISLFLLYKQSYFYDLAHLRILYEEFLLVTIDLGKKKSIIFQYVIYRENNEIPIPEKLDNISYSLLSEV